jgi:hypothetical protein
MAQYSVSQSLLAIYLDSFQDGLSPSLLVDTLTVINIVVKIMLLPKQVKLRWFSHQPMVQSQPASSFTNLRVTQVLDASLECLTLRSQLDHLLNHALVMHLIVRCLWSYQQKTLFLKNTMVSLWTFSKKNTIRTTKQNSKHLTLIMSIV